MIYYSYISLVVSTVFSLDKNSRETTQPAGKKKTTCDFQNACAKENKHVSNHLDPCVWYTPRKTNMEPKNGGLEDAFLFKGMIFMFHVSFRGE